MKLSGRVIALTMLIAASARAQSGGTGHGKTDAPAVPVVSRDQAIKQFWQNIEQSKTYNPRAQDLLNARQANRINLDNQDPMFSLSLTEGRFVARQTGGSDTSPTKTVNGMAVGKPIGDAAIEIRAGDQPKTPGTNPGLSQTSLQVGGNDFQQATNNGADSIDDRKRYAGTRLITEALLSKAAPTDAPVTEASDTVKYQVVDQKINNNTDTSTSDAPLSTADREKMIEPLTDHARDLLGVAANTTPSLNNNPLYVNAPAESKSGYQELLKNDMRGASPSTQIKPLQSIVTTNGFQNLGAKKLGADSMLDLNATVAAATATANPKNGRGKAQNVAKLYSQLTGRNPGGSAILGAGANLQSFDQELARGDSSAFGAQALDDDTLRWLKAAHDITTPEALLKPWNGHSAPTLRDGAKSLDVFVATLRRYQMLGLLKLVQVPMHDLIHEQIESLASIQKELHTLRHLPSLPNNSEAESERARLRNIADATLKSTLSNAASAQKWLQITDAIFSDDSLRLIYRKHDKSSYQRLRSATAVLYFSLQTQDLVQNKPTPMAVLIRDAFDYLKLQTRLAAQHRAEKQKRDLAAAAAAAAVARKPSAAPAPAKPKLLKMEDERD